MGGKTNTKSLTNITDAHTRSLVYKHTFVKLHGEKKKRYKRKREKRTSTLGTVLLYSHLEMERKKGGREREGREQGIFRRDDVGGGGIIQLVLFLGFSTLG